MATLDVKKAFLKGVTYEELADLTGEPIRNVNFEITEEVAKILRRFPGYEKFDRRLHVLRNKKPGTGTKDAPRCFAIKLRRATHDEFGAKSTTHDPQLIVKHETGALTLIGTIHVDDIKIAWGDDKVFDLLIKALEKIFGKR